MKIIGATVGTSLPKPSFAQTDPKKGDYIRDKEVLDDRYYTEDEIDSKLNDITDRYLSDVGQKSQVQIITWEADD